MKWYAVHRRDLPWRHVDDPYAIWVSEIMLQQTRVEAVLPYYQRWMQQFPTLPDLASATQQNVLAAWEGLGYYSRARNLHRAAQEVTARFGGQLPRDPAVLRQLPGIGRYTAGAIASMAFGLDEPVLDGNVRRVYSRLFDVRDPARSSQSERYLWELAEAHLPAGRAGDYNQALMDLGALVCTPRAPDCERCPLAEFCRARILAVQEQRPVPRPKRPLPHHTVTAAVIQRDGQVLIVQRPAAGLLGGMWEFPGGKQLPGENLSTCLQREIREELGVAVDVHASLGVYRHAYTHFRVTLHAFRCQLTAGEPRPIEARALRWVPVPELSAYPMGKIDRQISKLLGTERAL